MSDKLLPCPFCGSSSLYIEDHYIACNDCLTEGPRAAASYRRGKSVTEAWNTRAASTSDAIKEALEFYADPFSWKIENDPNDDVQVPDFYNETSFGDRAVEALAAIRATSPCSPTRR